MGKRGKIKKYCFCFAALAAICIAVFYAEKWGIRGIQALAETGMPAGGNAVWRAETGFLGAENIVPGDETGSQELENVVPGDETDSLELENVVPELEEGWLESQKHQSQQMGHLIQTTTFEEEYMGMVNCGGTVSFPLEHPDINAAYEKVKRQVVKINGNGYLGSGVIWEMDREGLTIISSKHLLQYWGEDSFVTFYGGHTAKGRIESLSEENDLGYLRVDAADVGYEELVYLRAVEKSSAAYENMAEGDILFYVGSADGAGENEYQGTFESGWWYIEEFHAHMILGFGYGKPGMSGGGTFDAYGRFIGMISGGTGGGEIASMPVSTILEDEKREKGVR